MLSKISKLISKKNKSKIICLTAYSKNIAEELDNYADLILVGDSLGSVLYNYKSTRNVTLDSMIEHSKSVRLGGKKFKSDLGIIGKTLFHAPFNCRIKSSLKNFLKIISHIFL